MFQGRKIFTLLISLLAAVLLWLYVVTTVTPETDVRVSSIPISINGMSVLEERGLVITEQNDKDLDLDLRTARDNLSKLNASTIRVNADASNIREPGSYKLDCVVTFPDTVRSSNVEILRKSELVVTVERLDYKTFDVQFYQEGSAKEGFVIEDANVVMEPKQVVVTGLEEELNQIKEVAVFYDGSNLEETVTQSVQLHFLDENNEDVSFSEHTSASATETVLTLPVYRIEKIPLKVNLVKGGGVTPDNANVELDPPSIHVKGPKEKMEELNGHLEDGYFVVGDVDLSKVPDSSKEVMKFPLVLPEGIININENTSEGGLQEVSVEIKLTGVSKDSIEITDIRLSNAPAEMESTNLTKRASVTVRGSTEEIDKIKKDANNGFYIVVDLAAYADQNQKGKFVVSGKVVNENYPLLSVQESVNITVEISEPEEINPDSE